MVIIMKFKSSIQREADRFFKEVTKEDFNIRKVTKSAFSQARAKLNPEAFLRLNKGSCKIFYRDACWIGWKGKRLLAEDGTRLLLPNHKSIEDKYGSHMFGQKASAKRSMATATILYDPLNLIALDASLSSYGGKERELLIPHLEHVGSNDILLLDRGYSCYWLLFLLTAKGVDFCVRLQNNWWHQANELSSGDHQEQEVELTLPKKDYSKLSHYPQIRDKKIKVRLVKIPLENGTHQILCTSLQEESLDELKYLYGLRWNIEEGFKLLKSRIELENFSGKTAHAIEQDFYAKVFLLSLTSMYAHPIEQRVRKEYHQEKTKKKYSQKINRTNAIATMQDILIGSLIKKLFRKAIDAFDLIVYKSREAIRPFRKIKRIHKHKRPYRMNYKHL
jgi:hypothetical protein